MYSKQLVRERAKGWGELAETKERSDERQRAFGASCMNYTNVLAKRAGADSAAERIR